MGELTGYSSKSHFTPFLFLAKCGAQPAGREEAEFLVLLLGQTVMPFLKVCVASASTSLTLERNRCKRPHVSPLTSESLTFTSFEGGVCWKDCIVELPRSLQRSAPLFKIFLRNQFQLGMI